MGEKKILCHWQKEKGVHMGGCEMGRNKGRVCEWMDGWTLEQGLRSMPIKYCNLRRVSTYSST